MGEMNLKEATSPHRGGETRALDTLNELCKNEEYMATFEKPKTAPTAFEPRSTTVLSPHMHFGSLSVREFYWRAHDISKKFPKKASSEPANLTGQLVFRDMYFGAQAALGYKFGQTVGNSHVRFVPWHLRSEIDSETGLRKLDGSYIVDSEEAKQWLRRWKYGITGFPWIDAAMRQLRQEGWIHHLARHAVACFLTRGGCYIDWERGAEVFEEWLVDHETACNSGNWQWLSCTAFYAQFYRCYSPIAFPQKTDKSGEYVRRYVPELKDLPAKYIYEPWKAPIPDQKKAGVRIQGDGSQKEADGLKVYPKPMFDFPVRREVCISGLKNAYDVGLYGNDKRVLDGTWRQLFDDKAEGPTEGSNDKDAPESTVVHGVDGFDDDAEHYHVGEEQVEDEAKAVGGETKGGDHEEKSGKASRRAAAPRDKKQDDGDHKRKRNDSKGTLDSFVKSPSKKKMK